MRVKLIGVSNAACKCNRHWVTPRLWQPREKLPNHHVTNGITDGLTMRVDSYGFIRCTFNYPQDACARPKWLALQVLWSGPYNRTPCAWGQPYNSFGSGSCSQRGRSNS